MTKRRPFTVFYEFYMHGNTPRRLSYSAENWTPDESGIHRELADLIEQTANGFIRDYQAFTRTYYETARKNAARLDDAAKLVELSRILRVHANDHATIGQLTAELFQEVQSTAEPPPRQDSPWVFNCCFSMFDLPERKCVLAQPHWSPDGSGIDPHICAWFEKNAADMIREDNELQAKIAQAIAEREQDEANKREYERLKRILGKRD